MRWIDDTEELKKTIAKRIKADNYKENDVNDVIDTVLQIISESLTVQPFVEEILGELQEEKTKWLSFIDGIDYAISGISAKIDTQKGTNNEID